MNDSSNSNVIEALRDNSKSLATSTSATATATATGIVTTITDGDAEDIGRQAEQAVQPVQAVQEEQIVAVDRWEEGAPSSRLPSSLFGMRPRPRTHTRTRKYTIGVTADGGTAAVTNGADDFAPGTSLSGSSNGHASAVAITTAFRTKTAFCFNTAFGLSDGSGGDAPGLVDTLVAAAYDSDASSLGQPNDGESDGGNNDENSEPPNSDEEGLGLGAFSWNDTTRGGSNSRHAGCAVSTHLLDESIELRLSVFANATSRPESSGQLYPELCDVLFPERPKTMVVLVLQPLAKPRDEDVDHEQQQDVGLLLTRYVHEQRRCKLEDFRKGDSDGDGGGGGANALDGGRSMISHFDDEASVVGVEVSVCGDNNGGSGFGGNNLKSMKFRLNNALVFVSNREEKEEEEDGEVEICEDSDGDR
jgi:hypothetical protein